MTHKTNDSSRYMNTLDDNVVLYLTRGAWSCRVNPQSLFQHLVRG